VILMDVLVYEGVVMSEVLLGSAFICSRFL